MRRKTRFSLRYIFISKMINRFVASVHFLWIAISMYSHPLSEEHMTEHSEEKYDGENPLP